MRLFALAALGAALAVTPTFAQPRPPEPPRPPQPPQADRPRDADGDRVRRLEDEFAATRRRLEQLEAALRDARESAGRPVPPPPRGGPEGRRPDGNDRRGDRIGPDERRGDRRPSDARGPDEVNRPAPEGPRGFGTPTSRGFGPGRFPAGGGFGGTGGFAAGGRGFGPPPAFGDLNRRLDRIEKDLAELKELLRKK